MRLRRLGIQLLCLSAWMDSHSTQTGLGSLDGMNIFHAKKRRLRCTHSHHARVVRLREPDGTRSRFVASLLLRGSHLGVYDINLLVPYRSPRLLWFAFAWFTYAPFCAGSSMVTPRTPHALRCNARTRTTYLRYLPLHTRAHTPHTACTHCRTRSSRRHWWAMKEETISYICYSDYTHHTAKCRRRPAGWAKAAGLNLCWNKQMWNDKPLSAHMDAATPPPVAFSPCPYPKIHATVGAAQCGAVLDNNY